MAKIIVFCADGTWNRPDQDADEDRQPDPTNVYRLFMCLDGELAQESIRLADEQEKVHSEGARALQVAKYIHGVGDSRNPIIKILGGAFGAGIISRVVRGYTFISRHHEEGDHIVVAGFSRGAYTARALAGLIASQGLLANRLTADKEEAYRWGAMAWYRYRKQANTKKRGWLPRLAEAVSDLPAFLSCGGIKDDDLVPVARIRAVAIWDTVGAMGVPRYVKDTRVDVYRFTDTILSPKVEHGFHAVALDEKRLDFTPTLWEPADNVLQVAFPGAHADVGGGYPTARDECGLSDIAFDWMARQLSGIGVRLTLARDPHLRPDPAGIAHMPWKKPPFNKAGKIRTRNLSGHGVLEHPSVAARMQAGPVRADPSEHPVPYTPANRP